METSEIKAQMDSTMTELTELLESFDPAEVNSIPFEGSWTAGELAQHLIMSGAGFAEILNGPLEETKRDPTEKIGEIRDTFLNFNIRMQSPDFVVPPPANYNKEEQVRYLKKIHLDITEVIKNSDLSKTCKALELPVIGFLTGVEAVHFVLYHTQRHIRQLKNIRQKLGERAGAISIAQD